LRKQPNHKGVVIVIFCAHPILDRTICRLMGHEVLEVLANKMVQEISANFAHGRMRLFVDYGSGDNLDRRQGAPPAVRSQRDIE
jgi:hypothetical protein